MYYLIVNELAGNGLAARVAKAVAERMEAEGIAYASVVTQYPLQATELAAAAAASTSPRYDAVFAVGGDGTVRETAAGLLGTQTPLGIIPAGTGNDIIKALGIPADPLEALAAQLAVAQPKRIDMGTISGQCFMNVVGTGFDIETLVWTEKFKKRFRGLLPYLLGVICSIANHRDVELELEIDGRQRHVSALLLAVANGRCIGGGMKVAPDARMDDGLFDVLIINHVPRWKMIFLLPAFISGKIGSKKCSTTCRARRVVASRPGQIMDIDGELVPMDRAEIAFAPEKLLVLA